MKIKKNINLSIKKHLLVIEQIILAGNELLFRIKKGKLFKKNIILFAFLRKTVRLLNGIKILLSFGMEEEAQLLARALIETKIHVDYLLSLGSKDAQKALNGALDYMMLDKMKMLNSSDFSGLKEKERTQWGKIYNYIKRKYTKVEFDKLRQFGFSGVALEQEAGKTHNKDLYDLSYRMYSRNTHAVDLREQLGEILMPKREIAYNYSRICALIGCMHICSTGVIDKINVFFGNPLFKSNKSKKGHILGTKKRKQ